MPDSSPTTSSAVMRAMARGAAMLRDAWLMIGMTALFFLLLEVGARMLHVGRKPVAAATDAEYEATAAALHPYRDSAWFRAMRVPGPSTLARFDPYRGWWPAAFASPGVTVDSLGIRRTVQAATQPPRRRVYLFGGSVAWGFRVRDEHTIASAMARGLVRRGISDIEVVNYGQSAFQSTQELTTLLLALRGDRAPEAAVFLNGHNDISSALDFRDPGHVANEDAARARFERRDTTGLRQELMALARHSAVVRAVLGSKVVVEDHLDSLSLPADCAGVASQYRNLYRASSALGHEFGFDVLYAWQPVVSTTGKRLSPYEAALPASGWRARHRKAQRDCGRVAVAEMEAQPGAHFVSLVRMFDRDTSTVFLDNFGHLTEPASDAVGDTLAALLAPMLRNRPQR